MATGIPALDQATGFAGIPRGRVSELTGPRGGGALTLGLRTLAAALDHGGVAAYVDLPGTFAATVGAALSLDLSRLVVVRPPDADAALQATATLLRSNAFEALLLDLESTRAARQPLVAPGRLGGTRSGGARGGDGVWRAARHRVALSRLPAPRRGLPRLALAAQPPDPGADRAGAGSSGC